MHDDGAVEDPGPVHERRPHDQDGHQVGRGSDHLRECHPRRLEQSVLQQQVVDRVAGQAQLGEHGHGDAVLVTGLREAITSRALAAGSATVAGSVHAATRANPCAYAEKKSTPRV